MRGRPAHPCAQQCLIGGVGQQKAIVSVISVDIGVGHWFACCQQRVANFDRALGEKRQSDERRD